MWVCRSCADGYLPTVGHPPYLHVYLYSRSPPIPDASLTSSTAWNYALSSRRRGDQKHRICPGSYPRDCLEGPGDLGPGRHNSIKWTTNSYSNLLETDTFARLSPILPDFAWFCEFSLIFAWFRLISPDFSQIHLNSGKFARIHLNSPEFTWIRPNSPEFSRIHLALPEFTWICPNSLQFGLLS